MANLASLYSTAKINRKKGTGTRPAGSSGSCDKIQISGDDNIDVVVGQKGTMMMSICYHRAKNRIVTFFLNGQDEHAYGVAAAPTADGESLSWGAYSVSGTSGHGWMMTDNFEGNACSYDREKEKILYAGAGHSPTRIETRVVDLDSTSPNTDNRSLVRGTAVTWAAGTITQGRIGPQALIYVGDDAGASAGKHVLIYSHSYNNLRAVVGTIGSGNTVDWNTPLTNYAVCGTTTGGGSNYEAGGCKVADNKIAIYWTDGSSEAWCRVGTVASGAITFGTKVRLDTNGTNSTFMPSATSNCFDIASGKVVFAWWEHDEGDCWLKARIGTVSGTGITLGTTYEVIPNSDQSHGKVSLVYDEAAQRTVIYYKKKGSGGFDPYKLYSRIATITGTNITFGTEILVEAPASNYTFERGPNTVFSYGCCSTYVSHADIKKTLVMRPGGEHSGEPQYGGYPKATMTHLNKSDLTVDLSHGNAFELDIDTHTGLDGAIGSFTITESLGSGKTQMFQLKIIQGSPTRDFDWSTISNIKWPGGTGPTLTQTNNAVDVLSFITWDEGTTWYGKVEGLNF